MKSVVVTGNLADGFKLTGPFADEEDAAQYADIECSKDHWWVMSMESPNLENHPALQVPCKHCGAVGMCPAPVACVSAAALDISNA